MKPLTQRQKDLHDYLCERWPECPSIREIANHMGVNVNAVTGHLRQLQRKGCISIPADRRSRGIRLLDGPDRTGTEIEFAGRSYVLVEADHWNSITEESEHARALAKA